jgi:microcystin-dependent protein
MSEPFIGQITIYPYSFAPYQWADCAGQILAISQNAALFSLLGTYYGGNGTSNFALPNLQGQVGVNQGNLTGGSSYFIGEAGGTESVTLQSNQSGVHNHSLMATTVHGSSQSPGNNLLATGEAGSGRDASTASIYLATNPNVALTAQSIAPAGGSSGGTVPHNNVQPFLALRYCIALTGVFPARS